MATTADLKSLYQALDFERALDLDHPEDQQLYVELHSEGGVSPIEELRANIELAARPGTWLFTGHRGVGKSTELRRMAHELRQKAFYVVVADMDKLLNLGEPIKLESLLVSLAAALADQADQDLDGERTDARYATRLWEWLTKTEVNLTGFSAKVQEVGFTAQLRENPSFRAQVQSALEASPGTWFGQVKAFVKSVSDDIKVLRGPDTQIILILDSLERLRVSGPNAKACYEAIVQVFDVNGQYLKLEHVHTVYSVPPFLPFLVPRIGGYFGVDVCKLPHVKVFATPDLAAGAQDVQAHAVGVTSLVNTVRRRFPRVEEILPEAQLQRLALASSGSVRDYFRLIKSVCAKATVTNAALPLADDNLAKVAEKVLRDEMPLAEEDLKHLALVRQKHGVALDSMDNLHKVARLFDGGLILSYRNGIGDWCDAQYLLHEQIRPYLPEPRIQAQ